jgi:RNA polymerase sigma factor (sigma-70 family)
MSGLFRSTKTADFDRLYRRHAASVYRYAYAVLGSRADAEDVTQQTFLNAYRAMEKGTRPRKAENWLVTIAHNELRRHFQTTQRRRLEVELDAEFSQPAPERSDPSVADIVRALQKLPPAQRSALVMREFEGRSYAEVAAIMDVSQSALETLLFRARRSLAEELEDGLTCAEAESAVSLRLDGRLKLRQRRRLRAHLRECPLCARFERVQKRQRSQLGGLSVMPIPASLLLARGESAAAAIGLGATAAGASTASGVGAAGAAGIASGFVVKAAAVTAAAGVAGGVGYGVATRPPEPAPRIERTVAHAPVAVRVKRNVASTEVRAALPPSDRAPKVRAKRSQSPPTAGRKKPKLAQPRRDAKNPKTKAPRAPNAAAVSVRGRGWSSPKVKPRATTPAKPKHAATKAGVGRKAAPPVRAKPLKPARPPARSERVNRGKDPRPVAEAPGRDKSPKPRDR